MKKTMLVLLSAFLLFTADVLAGDKIIVLNTASNNGTMFSQSTAYAEDFKNMGYDVEFVSPGNACKAWAYLQKVPSNQPVFINIDAYGQAKPASGLLQNCGPILASKKDLVAAYLDHFHVCTINGSADELFSKGASTRIGTNKPGGFWQPVVDKINKENKSSHKRIQYGGSGDTRKALLSGEVDYVFLSTRHTYKLENAGATCFAEFTDSKKLKYEHTVNDLSAGKDKFDSSFATGWSLFNADKKMVKQLRVQIRSLFENDSNIIKALGGSTPLNYYGWDESISARVKWVNGSIDRWAQAMKQTAQ